MTIVSKKTDFSNFGTLEKTARRYRKLWERYLKDNSSAEDDNERAKIRREIFNKCGFSLRHDIIDSWENGDEIVYAIIRFKELAEAFAVFRALGFKKVAVIVTEMKTKKAREEAELIPDGLGFMDNGDAGRGFLVDVDEYSRYTLYTNRYAD